MTFARCLAALLTTVAAAGCGSEPPESWGFVATLGHDTTSVEWVTRRGDHLVGEAVGRSPTVVHRRWEATIAPDGSFRRWTMDSRLPNAPAGESDLHHELSFDGTQVRVIRRAGADSVDRTVATAYPRTVPWNAFLYATSERLVQAARGLPDSTHIGQYFFEGWAEGHFGNAQVTHLPNGEVALSSSGLAGSGTARLDPDGRMLRYSGAGTTYLQEVRRISAPPDIPALVERFAAAERAGGFSRWLSPRDTTQAEVAGTAITVDYSRPLARGRTLVGGVIPYDQVWRTGANAATQLTIGAPLRLAGMSLPAGTYTLWTLPTRTGVSLIVNRQTGQWGTEYGPSHDLGRAPMEVGEPRAPVERFTIRVDPAGPALVMEWGTFRWSAAIQPPR